MPAGLQVWGPDSSLWCDTTSSLGRVYGLQTVGPGTKTVSVDLVGLGTPFAMIVNPSFDTWSDTNGNNFRVPIIGGITFNSTGSSMTVSFTWAGYVNPYAQVYYGAF